MMTQPAGADDARFPTLAGFRAAVSRLPQGVAVLTTVDDDGLPQGVTVGSVIPLSKRPPLLAVSLDRRAGMLAVVLTAGRFAINVLHSEASGIATLFATPGINRFASTEWTPGGGGLPVLREHSSAVIECAVSETVDGGDHVIVIGAVEDSSPLPARGPRVYKGRRYFGLQPL